ncbi:methionine aminotransferase [Croceiramulus getboli]|nr:methionine aminotransferase [Flavobacteriaceae bacterium YJPT1-3]
MAIPDTLQLRSKLPDVGTTIFTVMSQLAHEHQALNLSQGFPNFEMDPQLIRLAQEAMSEGYNQYAPMAGIFSLREAIARKVERCYGATYDPEQEITVTVGATQAIFTAIATVIRPGDEVLLFKPAYDCYEPAIAVQGGTAVPLGMTAPDFEIPWQQVKQAISTKTKMIIINTPNNPSGKIWSRQDMEQLEAVTRGTDIVILSDEVYEHMVYDGMEHQSVARFSALRERSFITASFGKTFHNTGWKTGYCLAPSKLMEEFRKVHQFNVFCTNHPVQRAFAKYLEHPAHYETLPAFYQNKRDRFLDAVADSRFAFTPAEGTYFQLLDYSAISEESDTEFARRLVKEHGIASIPISPFMQEEEDRKLLRFCFAKTDDTLEAAGKILRGI